MDVKQFLGCNPSLSEIVNYIEKEAHRIAKEKRRAKPTIIVKFDK